VAGHAAEAVGSRELPQQPRRVWEALAVLQPYCAVCDVSYRVTGRGRGSTFVCLPGRVDGDVEGAAGTRGEIEEWQPPRRVTTRLVRSGETWTTRLELTGTGTGGTRVTMTIRCTPERAGLVGVLQRRALQRLVDRTLATELDRLPAHLDQSA
jgi:hypothetical protein